jgi:hypothetical protein
MKLSSRASWPAGACPSNVRFPCQSSARNKELRFDEGFRPELIVNDKVLLELKSVGRVTPAHQKKVQPYLRLTGLKLVYLLNFGEAVVKDCITRCLNRPEENGPQRRGDAENQSSSSPRLCSSRGSVLVPGIPAPLLCAGITSYFGLLHQGPTGARLKELRNTLQQGASGLPQIHFRNPPANLKSKPIHSTRKPSAAAASLRRASLV